MLDVRLVQHIRYFLLQYVKNSTIKKMFGILTKYRDSLPIKKKYRGSTEIRFKYANCT